MRDFTSFSLEEMGREPDRLEHERSTIDAQIEELAVGNYGSFVESSKCVRDAHGSLSTMQIHVGNLLTSIPAFRAQCEDFASDSKTLCRLELVNRNMIQNEEAMVQVLEIPRIADACLRNGLYEEILDLNGMIVLCILCCFSPFFLALLSSLDRCLITTDFIISLSLRYSSVSVFAVVAFELEGVMRNLHTKLVSDLSSKVQLPVCLRIFTYLRRMRGSDQEELRLLFLQARATWLDSLVADLGSPTTASARSPRLPQKRSVYEYLSAYLDLNRMHLFEIITQFRAIFGGSSSSTVISGSAETHKDSKRGPTDDNALLYVWGRERARRIVNTLQLHLEHVEEGDLLANVLEQSMYCGASLCRVGLDLRSLLHKPFETVICRLFASHIERVLPTFQEALIKHKLFIPLSTLRKLGIPTRMGDHELGANGVGDSDAQSKDPTTKEDTAPVRLEEFPALAAAANVCIRAINILKHCAPVSCKSRIVESLRGMVAQLAEELRAKSATAIDADMGKLIDAFCDEFMVFTSEVVAGVYEGPVQFECPVKLR